MASKKFIRILRQPAITAVVIAALLLTGMTAIPSVRTRLAANLDSGANLFLFDGDGSEDVNSDGGKSNTFKRIVSAPVRLVSRLFRRKKDDFAMKKVEEKDLRKLKIVPMNREKNGLPGEIADTSNTLATEVTSAEMAAQTLFEEAVELQANGRIDAAIEKLVAATVLEPDHGEAYNLLGVCYDQKGQYRSAQAEYKKAIKIDSGNARLLNNIGYSYYLSNDFGNAVKWYKKGLKLTPNDRRMHNNIGLAYGRKGDYKKAREHFVIAVGETGADLNLGYVYSQEGKYDEAIQHYESALRTQPQSLPALNNLAQLYERTGRLREAAVLGDQYKKIQMASRQKDQAANQE